MVLIGLKNKEASKLLFITRMIALLIFTCCGIQMQYNYQWRNYLPDVEIPSPIAVVNKGYEVTDFTLGLAGNAYIWAVEKYENSKSNKTKTSDSASTDELI